MFTNKRLRQQRQRWRSNLRRRRGSLGNGIVVVTVTVFVMVVTLTFLWSFSGGRLIQPSLLLRRRQKVNPPWKSDILHVVMTRFMQDQPDLVWLAKARLLLFQYICLPTMIHQSTQDFIWIIQTDPKLNTEIRSSLVKLLQSYPNYFLLGSNVQLINIRADNDDPVTDVLQRAPLYTGDVTLLRQVYDCRDSVPIVLQTRLDADDGLEMHYLELIQNDARIKFVTEPTPTTPSSLDWYFWCNRRHLEWYSASNRLTPVEHSHLCVTPGLTMGMRRIVDDSTTSHSPLTPQRHDEQIRVPPNLAHDVLFKQLEQSPGQCGVVGVVCIRMMDELPMGAIRSRTWTSAGMMDIFKDDKHGGGTSPQEQWWILLQKYFGIPPTLNIVQDFLKEHVIEIARDNLKGQCTEGHSCKQKSVEALKQLIQKQQTKD